MQYLDENSQFRGSSKPWRACNFFHIVQNVMHYSSFCSAMHHASNQPNCTLIMARPKPLLLHNTKQCTVNLALQSREAVIQ